MGFLHDNSNLALTIVLACLCLVALHLVGGQTQALPAALHNRKLGNGSATTQNLALIGWIAIGFVATVVVTNGLLNAEAMQRVHPASLFIRNAVLKADPAREQVVLLGSSQTSQGVDGVLLESLLHKSSPNVQVIQLSLAAMFNVETDLVLEEYLAQAPRRPLAVLIDIGFDSEHLPVVDTRRNSLAIAASNWPRTWQRIARSWLRYWQDIKAVEAGEPSRSMKGMSAFLSDILDSLNFFLCNVSNCAVLRQLNPDVELGNSSGVARHFSGHAPSFGASAILPPVALACELNEEIPASFMEPSLAFRRWQADKYTKIGIPIVGFYYPPNLTPRTACFQKQFCERIGGYSCLTLNNRLLLAELDAYDKWYDQFHLTDLGVPIFTASLARDIVKLLGSASPANESPAPQSR